MKTKPATIIPRWLYVFLFVFLLFYILSGPGTGAGKETNWKEIEADMGKRELAGQFLPLQQ